MISPNRGDLQNLKHKKQNHENGKFNQRRESSMAQHYSQGIDQYPSIFRQLAWWEHRDISDMPGAELKNRVANFISDD